MSPRKQNWRIKVHLMSKSRQVFKVRGILRIVKIQAKLLHLRHEMFSKLYRHLVTCNLVIYTSIIRLASRALIFLSQIFCGMHRYPNMFQIQSFKMENGFFPIYFQ